MSIRLARRIRTGTVLAVVTAAILTGAGAASAAPTTGPDSPGGEGSSAVGTHDAGWPGVLTQNARLTVDGHSYLVRIRDGRPTLVPSTAWDLCWVPTQYGSLTRYPC